MIPDLSCCPCLEETHTNMEGTYKIHAVAVLGWIKNQEPLLIYLINNINLDRYTYTYFILSASLLFHMVCISKSSNNELFDIRHLPQWFQEKKKSIINTIWETLELTVNINLTKLRTNCLSCSCLSSHGEHNMAFVRGALSFWLKETVSTVWESLFMDRYPDGSNEAFLLTSNLLKIPSNIKY